MRRLHLYAKYILCSTIMLASVETARADHLAYLGTGSGDFGTVDLGTGVFSSLGSTGQALAGLGDFGGSLYGAAYNTDNGTVYTVNPATGALTAIGSSGINIGDFGSTTSGLYALGSDAAGGSDVVGRAVSSIFD